MKKRTSYRKLNKLLAGCLILTPALMFGSAVAELGDAGSENNLGTQDSAARPQEDPEEMILIDGESVPISSLDNERDVRTAGANTGISVYRGGGSVSDIAPGGWSDAGVESSVYNGVIGGAQGYGKVGVIGVSRYDSGAGTVGYHDPDSATGPGRGVWAVTDSPNAYALHADNRAGGVAGKFEGDVIQDNTDNGLVKAAAYVSCNSSSSIVSQGFAPGGATPTVAAGPSTGCIIDFGFDISTRYFQATAPSNGGRLAACDWGATANQLTCYRIDSTTGTDVGGGIIVTIY